MRLVASEPVTIEKVYYGERWFPRLYRHTDGSLLMYVEYGHDRDFSPDFRLQSHDGGATWHTPTDNVPRVCCCHSFEDGQLWEVDTYGFHDPRTEDVSVFYGAWSDPGRPDMGVEKGEVRVHTPSLRRVPLKQISNQGYPTFHWWPLMNRLHGVDELTGDEVFLLGPYFTATATLADGRLLGVGYAKAKGSETSHFSSVAFVSSDRGRHWEELAVLGTDRTTPEGLTETDVIRLKDGRLYVVIRTGAHLMHSWSSDEGRTWSSVTPLRLVDEPDHVPGLAWPRLARLDDGTLLLAYGRPGKHVVFDPTGTGSGWRGRLNLQTIELQTQERRGVPPELRLRGPTHLGVRYWDSGDYLSVLPISPSAFLVTYDVQSYVESWNAKPYSGVRMVKVTLDR